MILPPPLTSDCTLDDVEAYLDAMNMEAQRLAHLAPEKKEIDSERVPRPGLAQVEQVRTGQRQLR